MYKTKKTEDYQFKLTFACPIKISEMIPSNNPKVLNCHKCNKNVYKIDEMSQEEIKQLVEEKEGKFCGIYGRTDGAVMTKKCITALKKIYIKRGLMEVFVSLFSLILLAFSSPFHLKLLLDEMFRTAGVMQPLDMDKYK